MLDLIADNIIPLLLGAALPLVALGLRGAAKALRAFVKSTATPLDDQAGNAAANALNGAADAIDPDGD